MKYTTVLLDADNTLFDFAKCEKKAFQLTIESVKIKYSDEIYENFSRINDSLWKMLEKNQITKPALRIERFRRMMKICFGEMGMEEISKKMALNYVHFLSEQGILIDGTETALEKLSQLCDIYLVTNGISEVQRGRLAQTDISKFLNDIFISDEIGAEKPNILFFEYVFAHIFEKEKANIIIVGDSLTSDMQGGRNAGIDTCLFDREDKVQIPHELCDFKIKKLSELCEILLEKKV